MRITGGLRVVGGLSIVNGINTNLPVLRWDPTYLPGDVPVSISADGTQVIDGAPGDYTIISTNAIPRTGAYMFSLRMDFDIDANVPDIGGYVGVGNRNFDPYNAMGVNANSYGFTDQGDVRMNNFNIDSGLPVFNYSNGAHIDIAVLDNSYIWIRVNGGHWNGDANSNLLDGTGGLNDMGALTSGDLYPMVTVAGSMGPTQFTILNTCPFGVPSGVTFFNMYTPPAAPALYTPTGTQSNYFGGGANFEMGTWSSSDPSTVPDVSISGHSFGLNDNAAGSPYFYHFLNTSAQANNWDWPTDMTPYLAVMGWFAFGSFNAGSTSMVTRNDGGPGWAFRVDSSGTVVNLVKYGDADQTITLNTPLTTNTWHFIAVTQNGSNVQFLVDGNLYSTTGSSNSFASSGGPVRLQYDPYTGGNQNVEMWMRDVKITQTNTPIEDIMTLYNNTKANYGY